MKNTSQVTTEILRLTGVSEQEYNQLQFSMGLQFATEFVFGNERAAQLMTHSPEYWNWFKNQWYIIDLAFANSFSIACGDQDVKESLKAMWLEEHKVENIKAHPGRYVMSHVRMAMIKTRTEVAHA